MRLARSPTHVLVDMVVQAFAAAQQLKYDPLYPQNCMSEAEGGGEMVSQAGISIQNRSGRR